MIYICCRVSDVVFLYYTRYICILFYLTEKGNVYFLLHENTIAQLVLCWNPTSSQAQFCGLDRDTLSSVSTQEYVPKMTEKFLTRT